MAKYDEIFIRNVPGMLDILRRSCIGIAGCGGLGSNAAVALTRAGIGKLILADFDRVEMSNLNRQYFFMNDVGKSKVNALSSHLLNINPDIELKLINKELIPEDIPDIFSSVDIMIEAFDKAETKKWLVEKWSTQFPEIPIVCASGLSGFGLSEELEIKKAGNIYMIGDQSSDMSMGLCSARVAIAANIQANTAIELLMMREEL